MLNSYHLAMVTQGAEVWSQWRGDSQVRAPELSVADLFEVDFTGYVLSGANLSASNLCKANFLEAALSRPNFVRAHLAEKNNERSEERWNAPIETQTGEATFIENMGLVACL